MAPVPDPDAATSAPDLEVLDLEQRRGRRRVRGRAAVRPPVPGGRARAPRCKGWRGATSRDRVWPCSTMRPWRTTATRSQVRPTTAGSWLIRMMDRPRRSRRSVSSRRICAWVVTSRAEVGSSAMRIRGLPRQGRRDHRALPHAHRRTRAGSRRSARAGSAKPTWGQQVDRRGPRRARPQPVVPPGGPGRPGSPTRITGSR